MEGTKKLSILLAVFGVLLIGVVIYNFGFSDKKQASYDPMLVQVDTSAIDKISITPKAGNDPFDVEKKNGSWVITAEGNQYPADPSAINNIISQLVEVKAQRVSATKKESWGKYELTDSVATHIKLSVSGTVVADIYLGKFSFKQSQNPYQRQPDITSYIRKAGDDRVYATNGMLSMTFNRQYTDLRNQTVLQTNPDAISSVEMQYGSNSYTLSNADSTGWKINGIQADSATTALYISSLRSVRHRDFADGATTDGLIKSAQVTVNTANGQHYAVSAFETGNNDFYITSDQNPETIFSSDSNAVFNKLFHPVEYFISAE